MSAPRPKLHAAVRMTTHEIVRNISEGSSVTSDMVVMTNITASCDAPFQVVVVSERHILADALHRTLGSICTVKSVKSPGQLSSETNAESAPPIVILDQSQWTADGVKEAVRSANSGVIAWLASISPEVALTSLEIGARGILGDRCSERDIVQCVTAIRGGGTWVPEELNTALLTRRVCKLTPREAELIALLTSGLRNKEIAYSLGITEGTVKVYLSKIFTKLGVSDRFELALFALRSLGILPSQTQLQQPTAGPQMRAQSFPRSVFPLRPSSQWLAGQSSTLYRKPSVSAVMQ